MYHYETSGDLGVSPRAAQVCIASKEEEEENILHR
jgi:hypothetical protein